VLIRFINSENDYLMEVEDDGVGMDILSMRKKGSLGYILVESLVKQLKGTLEMSSTPGQGSRSSIKFISKPLAPGLHS